MAERGLRLPPVPPVPPVPPERGPPDVQELINAAADKRPICPRWNTKRGCKKGRKCKLIHGRPGPPGDRTHTLGDLPWTSVHSVKPDLDDESIAYDKITLRPPLREAIQEYIKSKGLTRNFLLGSWQWTWTNSSGTRDQITFELGEQMARQDLAACS